MKAFLKNHRQAPRKVRLVTDTVKGQTIPRALATLSLINRKASAPITKIILSAVANAKQLGESDLDSLVISDIRVDKGLTQTRFRAQARGRAVPLKHESSHITVVLGKGKVKNSAKK